MSAIARAHFRANPRYELVLLDRLAPAQRRLLDDTERDADLYGVLRPRPGSGLRWQSVSTETALLFLTLGEPGPLPAYVVARLGDELERTIGRLVLDGVLDIEHQGEYLGGGRAAQVVMGGRSQGGRGHIGELSLAALRYAQELDGLPEPLLATRLYCYGRRPVSPRLRRRLVDEAAVSAYLGLGPGGTVRAALDAGWGEIAPLRGAPSRWRRWLPRPATKSADASYKLYVSPAVDALEAALVAVASSFATAPGVTGFKLGADLHGVCRPDKLVVYFEDLDDLRAGAAVLRERLDGCPAHGVAFTAAITNDGLLSWGADPPAAGTSWRIWVTERLAAHLAAARDADPSELEPWRFALERLRLSGIDTETWAPTGGMWPQALATG